jgi:hypothetical protein
VLAALLAGRQPGNVELRSDVTNDSGDSTTPVDERSRKANQRSMDPGQACPGRDSNPYDLFKSEGFKPSASAISPPGHRVATVQPTQLARPSVARFRPAAKSCADVFPREAAPRADWPATRPQPNLARPPTTAGLAHERRPSRTHPHSSGSNDQRRSEAAGCETTEPRARADAPPDKHHRQHRQIPAVTTQVVFGETPFRSSCHHRDGPL